MSKITTNDIINLAGIEAEIARLEKVNTELTKLATTAKQEAATIKSALKNVGGSASELGKIQGQAQRANSGFKSLQSQITKNNANLKTLQAKLNGVRGSLGKVTAASKSAAPATNRLAAATNKASGSMGRFQKSSNAASASLKRWIGGLIGYHLVERFATSVVRLGIEMDRLEFTYKTILRGQGELDRAWQFTSKLANDYGISIIEVRDSFIKFRAAADAAGISATGTEEMFDTFTKTSAVLGLSTEKAGLALRALSQIAAKGTVQMEELRGQLGEQIPGAVSLMAEGMGIGLGQFERMVANGEILSNEALPALAEQMKKTFNLDLIDNIDTAQTAVGRLSTAYAEFTEALDSGEAVKIAAKALTVFLKWLTNNSRALFSMVKALAAAAAAMTVYKIGVLVAAISTGTFSTALATSRFQLVLFGIASRAAAASMALLSAAINLNPVLLSITAIAAATYAWSEYSNEIKNAEKAERKRMSLATSELAQIEKIKEKLDEENVSRNQLLRIIKKINSINPEILAGLDAEKAKHEDVTTAINAHASALEGIRAGDALHEKIGSVSGRIKRLESRRVGNYDNLDPFQREELGLLKEELSELNKLAEQTAISEWFGGPSLEEDINKTVKGLEKIRIEAEKAKKDREAAEKAYIESEKERLRVEAVKITFMEEGARKELALLLNKHEKFKLQWRDHHDVLLLEEERYQKERSRLVQHAFGTQSAEGIGGFDVTTPASLGPGPFDNTPEKDKADFLGRAAQIGLDGAKDLKNLEDVEAKKRKIRKEATDFAMKQIKKLADYQLQIAEEELRRADQKVQTATAELNAQVALADAGYAANVGNAQRNLQLEKDNQKKALEDKKKAQKAQLALDAISQISNLVTATTEIWKGQAGQPIVGPALAIAATALMWGSFAAAQVASFKAVKKQKYGKGGLEIIRGGTHASGNDTPLGFSVNGREAYGEKGEAHMIVSARNTKRYKNLLPEIEKGLNSGTFESMLNANISPIINNGTNVDMSRTERHLRDIKNQGERQRFVDKNGNIVESYKNLTVRYK